MALSTRFLLVLFSLFAASANAFTPRSAARTSRTKLAWGVSPRPTAATVTRDDVVMMPATIEREKVGGAGPAVLDRPEVAEKQRVDEPVKERKGLGSEAWEVRIYNDGMNTREHVARSLVQVCGMSEMEAYQTMMQAHQNGIAVVGRWAYEVAEMYHEALKKNGIICDLVPVDEE